MQRYSFHYWFWANIALYLFVIGAFVGVLCLKSVDASYKGAAVRVIFKDGVPKEPLSPWLVVVPVVVISLAAKVLLYRARSDAPQCAGTGGSQGRPLPTDDGAADPSPMRGNRLKNTGRSRKLAEDPTGER